MLSGRSSKNEGPVQIKEVSRAEQIGDSWQFEAIKAASREKDDSMAKFQVWSVDWLHLINTSFVHNMLLWQRR